MSHVDALGKQVVIGNTYGYSVSSSGIGSVVIGKAVRLTGASKVSIEVASRKRFIYGEPINEPPQEEGVASVHAYNLFPVA